jgi:hypothetical protein
MTNAGSSTEERPLSPTDPAYDFSIVLGGPLDATPLLVVVVPILIPVVKAWSTDLGCESASMAIQVHGGMGFIEETGAAQYLRDARITTIYEGTTGIQAADLAGRKLSMDQGVAMRALIAEFEATVADLGKASGNDMVVIRDGLREGA